jgi:rhodanese-related sulfurtransferase
LDKANARYAAAVEHATVHLPVPREEVLADQENLTLLDVRRAGAYEASKSVITGATWRDPEKVAEWSSSLRDKPVVVYCVYGHEVGQSTAAILRTRVSKLASWSAGFTTGPQQADHFKKNSRSIETSSARPKAELVTRLWRAATQRE